MLYEVITVSDGAKARVEVGHGAFGKYPGIELGLVALRRPEKPPVPMPHVAVEGEGPLRPGRDGYVITSYSIHYTKLYELFDQDMHVVLEEKPGQRVMGTGRCRDAHGIDCPD